MTQHTDDDTRGYSLNADASSVDDVQKPISKTKVTQRSIKRPSESRENGP